MSDLVDRGRTGSDVRERWTEIRRIAQGLLQHARNRDWKAVGELHARREELIRSFFAEPVVASQASEVREGVRAVLESDKEVMVLIRQEKSNAAAEMHRLQSGREARKAYTDIGNRN